MISASGKHNSNISAPRVKKLSPTPQRSAMPSISAGIMIEVSPSVACECSALLQAEGGYTYRADQNFVVITRNSEDHRADICNARALLLGMPSSPGIAQST